MSKSAIYLDANAGAPLNPRVQEALLFILQGVTQGSLANPSSQHQAGRKARFELQKARESVAESWGVQNPSEILFTSCGTESIQTALRSVFEPALREGRRPLLITSAVEHDATLQVARWLQAQGGQVEFAAIDAWGRVTEGALRESWSRALAQNPGLLGQDGRPRDSVVSLIWVNNETGVIQPVTAIRDEAASLQLPVHWDAAQAWGKLPIDAHALGATWISASAHKIGGLSGTGVLWSRRAIAGVGILGKQESERRGGTENFLGIVAAGLAARLPEVTGPELAKKNVELQVARDFLEARLRLQIPGLIINGEGAPRVSNTTHISIPEVEKPNFVAALDLAGFQVSVGSACSSGLAQPSHVLKALGRSAALARASLRISMSGPLSQNDAERFAQTLAAQANRLRATPRDCGGGSS